MRQHYFHSGSKFKTTENPSREESQKKTEVKRSKKLLEDEVMDQKEEPERQEEHGGKCNRPPQLREEDWLLEAGTRSILGIGCSILDAQRRTSCHSPCDVTTLLSRLNSLLYDLFELKGRCISLLSSTLVVIYSFTAVEESVSYKSLLSR